MACGSCPVSELLLSQGKGFKGREPCCPPVLEARAKGRRKKGVMAPTSPVLPPRGSQTQALR